MLSHIVDGHVARLGVEGGYRIRRALSVRRNCDAIWRGRWLDRGRPRGGLARELRGRPASRARRRFGPEIAPCPNRRNHGRRVRHGHLKCRGQYCGSLYRRRNRARVVALAGVRSQSGRHLAPTGHVKVESERHRNRIQPTLSRWTSTTVASTVMMSRPTPTTAFGARVKRGAE